MGSMAATVIMRNECARASGIMVDGAKSCRGCCGGSYDSSFAPMKGFLKDRDVCYQVTGCDSLIKVRAYNDLLFGIFFMICMFRDEGRVNIISYRKKVFI